MLTEYVGQAFVIEPDGEETEVRALLRLEGRWLVGRHLDWPGQSDRHRCEP
jgi:hypothetical protein